MKLPNLELIEYKCQDAVGDMFELTRPLKQRLRVEVDVFKQTWGTTATGFDMGGCMAGQAFTDEYTTVAKVTMIRDFWDMHLTSAYVVCFGNNIAYVVKKPNELFFDDLRNRNMKSQKYASKYEQKEEEQK